MKASGAAVHESAHAIIAVLIGLDLRDVYLTPDGSGVTRLWLSGDRSGDGAGCGSEGNGASDAAAVIASARANPATLEGLLSTIRHLLPGNGDVLNHLVFCMSGRVAQGMVQPAALAWCGQGDEATEELLLAVAASDGPSRCLLYHQALTRARCLVERHWSIILDVAARLDEVGVLDGRDVKSMIEEAEVSARAATVDGGPAVRRNEVNEVMG